MRRFFWIAVLGLVVVSFTDLLDGVVVGAALFGLLVYKVGIASLASLRRGASYIPDGPPEPVDVSVERTVYWCGGCGAELLLLVRGAEVAPRHCGERMSVRAEVTRAG